MNNLTLRTEDSIPGVRQTTLEERWQAAKQAVEAVLRAHKVSDLPDDDDPECDIILDEIDRSLDALGLNFVSKLVKA